LVGRIVVIIFFGVIPGIFAPSSAETSPSLRPSSLNVNLVPRARLRVCSQNLANYGIPTEVAKRVLGRERIPFEIREELLVRRIKDAGCQVLAVQEIVGSSWKRGHAGLNRLKAAVERATGKKFTSVLGGANPGDVRCGFLISEDGIKLERAVSYAGGLLPKVLSTHRLERLSRGPLVVQLSWRDQQISIVNIHFKSKYGGGRDPSRLQFELLRMQMAQHLRGLAEGHFLPELLGIDHWFIVVGDRNSRRGSASDSIIRGELSLVDFRRGGDGYHNHNSKENDFGVFSAGCIVDRAGEAVCPEKPPGQIIRFDSVLEGGFVRGKPRGSFKYRSSFEWIDDILINRWRLSQAITRGETPRGGVIWEPEGASDHAMISVDIYDR
jgi:hypothetical protein